jgi:protein-tyrosine-phosphatase
MAEGLAQSWLENGGHKHWQAVSAGTFATEGAPTSKETLHALSQREIEFNGTSAPLTGEMIHSAHIVLCMTQSHMDMANQLAGDVTTIELLDPDGPIPDPAGYDQLVYDALADKMECLVAQRLETIIQKAGNS